MFFFLFFGWCTRSRSFPNKRVKNFFFTVGLNSIVIEFCLSLSFSLALVRPKKKTSRYLREKVFMCFAYMAYACVRCSARFCMTLERRLIRLKKKVLNPVCSATESNVAVWERGTCKDIHLKLLARALTVLSFCVEESTNTRQFSSAKVYSLENRK